MKMQTTRPARWIGLMGVIALVLSACSSANTERAGQAAEVILTRSAGGTPADVDATSTVAASSALTVTVAANTTPAKATPLPPGVQITATPSLVYARCLARQAAEMRTQPNDTAPIVTSLAARDVFTAYGRTLDAGWVLGWSNDQAFGWAPVAGVGCTVPIAELMPTEPNVLLLTPTGVAVAQVDATATQSLVPTTEATQTPAIVPSPVPLTDTPIPIAPAPTTAPPISTSTVAPTVAPTETPTTELQPLPTQTPFVVIQVVTVVVTVLVPVIAPEATATPRPAPTPTSVPTLVPTVVPILAPTVPPAPTSTPDAVAQGLSCEVTPGTPVNFRLGPSRTDRLIGTLRSGTSFTARGRNDDGTWLYRPWPTQHQRLADLIVGGVQWRRERVASCGSMKLNAEHW